MLLYKHTTVNMHMVLRRRNTCTLLFTYASYVIEFLVLIHHIFFWCLIDGIRKQFCTKECLKRKYLFKQTFRSGTCWKWMHNLILCINVFSQRTFMSLIFLIIFFLINLFLFIYFTCDPFLKNKCNPLHQNHMVEQIYFTLLLITLCTVNV